MLQLTDGWEMELERGPDWLFVRLRGTGNEDAPVADALRQLLQQEFTHRLVVELDELPVLCSFLLGELLRLQKLVQKDGGVVRVCGLSTQAQQLLRRTHLQHRFPVYRDRTEAVMGCPRLRPR